MMEIRPRDEENDSKVVKDTKNILFLGGKELNDLKRNGIVILVDGFKSAFVVDKMSMRVYKCSASKRSLENLTRKIINQFSTVIDYSKDGYVSKDELSRFWVKSTGDVYLTCLAYKKQGKNLKIGQRVVCIRQVDGSIEDTINELVDITDPEGCGFEIDLIGYNIEKKELSISDKTDRSLELVKPCSEILYITGTSIEMKLRFTLQKRGTVRVSNALG